MQRILFFHTHIWRNYYRDLLTHLVREKGSTVGVVSNHPDRHHWRRLVAEGQHHYLTPDLRKPRPFEASPEATAELQKLVERCEAATGKSASRIILTAERDMGRAFSQGYFIWFQTPLWRWCGKDPRRVRLALLRTFDVVRQAMEDLQPDLILSRGLSERYSLAAWFLARERGIPMLTCRFSKLASKKAFWTDDYHMYNTRADQRYSELDSGGAEPEPEFSRRVAEFREKPVTVDYIAQNWKREDKASIGTHLSWLRQNLSEELRFYRKGRKGAPPPSTLAKLVERCRIGRNARRNAGLFRTFEPQALESLRFAYLALHKEPELMLNFESPLWHDQRHMVKYLASMLPSNLTLLVKEHRFNWGRRSRAYLKFLADLPGVVLIHPFDDQFKYLRYADLVITDNGSTGWEGLMLKKPVITLERTLYDAPGLTRQVFDPRTLDAAMLEALKAPLPSDPAAYDRKLALRLQAEDETTVPIEAMHQDMELSVRAIQELLPRSET